MEALDKHWVPMNAEYFGGGERGDNEVWKANSGLVPTKTFSLFAVRSRTRGFASEPVSFPALSVCAYPPCGGCWGTEMRKPRWVHTFKSQEGLGRLGLPSSVGGKLKVGMRHAPVSIKWRDQKQIPKKMWRREAERQEAGFQFVIVELQ